MRALSTLLMLGWLTASCGTQPTRPAVEDVRIDLQLSGTDGSPTRPIIATVKVSNDGSRDVYYWVGCGCPSILLEVLGPDGEPLGLEDPCAPYPLCPCGATPLKPGGTITGYLKFTGAAFRIVSAPGTPRECAPDSARAGDYVVVARYGYSITLGAASKTVERRVPFHWSGS